MGLLSSTVSINRYRVIGKIEAPIKETIFKGLKKFGIDDIENENYEKTVGWTSFDNPYNPNFEGLNFEIVNFFAFSLRIDKKNISSKLIQKSYAVEYAKQIKQSGREYLSKNEKKALKEHVENLLLLQMPATPNIYDILWDYEKASLYFFSTLKSANEELETLFFKSFNLSLVRLFPYTMAELLFDLSDSEKDILLNLSPTQFTD